MGTPNAAAPEWQAPTEALLLLRAALLEKSLNVINIDRGEHNEINGNDKNVKTRKLKNHFCA